MIIIGYPYIGKTTLAASNNKIIDLDSNNFLKDNEYWYENYCKIAENLSKQGYIVFVSCHKGVQDYFIHSDENVWKIFPEDTAEMYFCWVNKAKKRYKRTLSQKDDDAWGRIWQNFSKDIRELKKNPIKQKIILDNTNYDLKKIVDCISKGLHVV